MPKRIRIPGLLASGLLTLLMGLTAYGSTAPSGPTSDPKPHRPAFAFRQAEGRQGASPQARRAEEYSTRESRSRDLEGWTGGQEVEVVYVGGVAILVVAVILLIILL